MVEEKGTGIFMDEPGLESAEDFTAAEFDQGMESSQKFTAEVDHSSSCNIEDETEETLPAEFLENAETFSSVLPRADLEDEIVDNFNSLETVTMTPSEVRRLSSRPKAKGIGSSRRTTASTAGARRTRKIEEAELSPEEVALRRRNDIKAKMIIYGIVLLSVLVFAALLTYKLPGLLPDYFPEPIWPWNIIFPDNYY